MLSKETINELSTILREDYGANLSNQEVFEVAQTLVGFFDHLMKLDFKDKNENDNHEKERLHKII